MMEIALGNLPRRAAVRRDDEQVRVTRLEVPGPLKRYTSLSITLAGSAHLAPSGAGGIWMREAGLSGTWAVKDIHLPSGDQAIPAGAWVRFVSLAVCPVSIQRR